MENSDHALMRLALREARKAAAKDEVPVGAVVTGPDGKVLARAHNLRETSGDPTAHAELLALRKVAGKRRRPPLNPQPSTPNPPSWRLSGCTLYVTLEPCPMCAGALVNARIGRLVYGCADPKAGACGTLMDIVRDKRLNHRVDVSGGVLEAECSAMLKEFFRNKRKR